MKIARMTPLLVSVALIASSALACAPRDMARPKPASPSNEVTETTSDATPPAEADPDAPQDPRSDTKVVKVYFVRAEKIGAAGRTVDLHSSQLDRWHESFAAVEALLEGPTAKEKEFGLTTTIPAGTELNGVSVVKGVATVDLSNEFQSGGGSLSMLLRVTQVVCTLTQYPDIKTVAFKLDGKPVTAIGGEGVIVSPPVDRADFEGQLPAIMVESPVPGQSITSPVPIRGSSNVFEATHQINVTDPDGLIIAKKTVTATSGTGTRGTWSESVAFPPVKRSGLGAVIVFEYSAKDGKPINVVEIPVYMTK